MTSPAAQTERLRLGALRNYKILDTPREEPFERIVRLARAALHAPFAEISFVDRKRVWSKTDGGALPRERPRAEAFCAQAIMSDAPLVVPDARADARFAALPAVTGAPFIRSYVGVPLRTPAGMRIGALCVMDTVAREPGAEEIALLSDLAHLVMDELELRLVATTDTLTGALSRVAFLQAAAAEIVEARRRSRALSCIMLDVDHFKAVNDAHSHATGDRVLHELALLLRAHLRGGRRGPDTIGRLGGEEFAILLHGAGRVAAREIGERLRERVLNARFAVPGGQVQLTVSLGVATLRHADAGIEDLLRRADDALYAAQMAGRNRLVADDPAPLELVVT
ncbi:MAG: GGDEF domain-containing protein [Pseudolabrys sp.]